MDDPVWHRIARELARRKAAHLLPATWADIGRAVDPNTKRPSQVTTNWGKRGVPSKALPAIARAFGWSVDQLLGLADLPSGSLAPRAPAVGDSMARGVLISQLVQLALQLEPDEIGRLLVAANNLANVGNTTPSAQDPFAGKAKPGEQEREGMQERTGTQRPVFVSEMRRASDQLVRWMPADMGEATKPGEL